MAPTRPIALHKQNSSKLPNAAVLSLFDYISVSTNGYIPDSTLKVGKIHRYSDIHKFAKTAFFHLLLFLLLLQLDRPTKNWYVYSPSKTTDFWSVYDPRPMDSL